MRVIWMIFSYSRIRAGSYAGVLQSSMKVWMSVDLSNIRRKRSLAGSRGDLTGQEHGMKRGRRVVAPVSTTPPGTVSAAL